MAGARDLKESRCIPMHFILRTPYVFNPQSHSSNDRVEQARKTTHIESKPRSIHPHPQQGEAEQLHGLHKHLLMENEEETRNSVNFRITLMQ